MECLKSQTNVPFADRDDPIRLKILEVVDALQGDIIKYEISSAGGGIKVLMPTSETHRSAIRTFLESVGLVATGEFMDTEHAYQWNEEFQRYARDYSYIERFSLEEQDG